MNDVPMKKPKKKKRKQPNLLLRLTCNNCDAIISENKEKLKEGRVRPTVFGPAVVPHPTAPSASASSTRTRTLTSR